MTATHLDIYPDVIQGSDAWHDQRRGIVTASVVGQLITTRRLSAIDYTCPACAAHADEPCRSKIKAGAAIKTLHPERAEVARRGAKAVVFEPASNDTSRALTALIVAERVTGWTDPTYVSDDMLRGIEEEPRARAAYSKHHAPVQECGFMVRRLGDVRIGYSPDGLVGGDGLIEIKSRRPKNHLAHVVAGHPPPETMAQLQCGLLVSGRGWIDYVSHCGGMALWTCRVFPDRRWFDAILTAVTAFEANAAEMQRLYCDAVEGLPETERTIEMEMVI